MDVERLGERIGTLYDERSEPLGLDELANRRRSADAAVRSRPWRGLLVAALAGVAGLVVFALPAWIGREPSESPETRVPVTTTAPPVAPSTPVSTSPQIPRSPIGGLGGWTARDLPSDVATSAGVMVWTGSELVFWGGETGGFGGLTGEPGAAYDPETATWRTIAASPMRATYGAAGAWTGEVVIVCCGASSRAAAAYDPTTDAWRSLPDVPLPEGHGDYSAAVWTGEEALVINEAGIVGFRPTTETWRVFDASPRPLGRQNEVAWTGERLVVWPANHERATFRGMTLDPTTGDWDVLPEPPAWPAVPGVVWTGRDLLVWGALPASGPGSERAVGSRFDLETGTWTELPEALSEPDGNEGNIGSQAMVWTGEEAVVSTGFLGTGVDKNGPLLLSYQPSSDEWTLIGRSPVGWGAEAVMAGDRVVFRSDRLYVSDPGWTPEGPVVTAETIGPFDVVIDGAGIKVTHPSDWYQAREDLTPNAGLAQRVAVGTYGLGPGGPRCAHMPVTAMRDLGPTDVFLYLEEGVPIASPGEWDARPATFAGWLTGIDEGTDAWECMRDDERGNIGALRWLAFAQSGRGLYLLAVIGTDASDEDVATAARILDSLEVEEAAGEEPPLDGFLDFRPETEIVDGREVVDLVFTDGSVVEASWPEELALADIGVRPTTSAQGEGHSSEFFIRHSAVEDVVAGFGRAEVLEEVENGRGGHVTLWRFNREAWRKVLTFQFGDWAVLAFDDSFLTSTPDPDLDTWARELYGAVTDDGFLVLSGGPSMTVAKPSEDPHPDMKLLSARGQVQLELAVDCSPGAISDPIGDGDDHASWCSADGRVFVRVRGSSDFATEVYEGLELVGPPEQAGTLSGELRAQGGPFPGVDDLTQVQVTVTGDATVLVLDVDGAFEVRLPVGEYEVTATFANNLPCESQRVIVSDDQTAEVEIVCNMR